MTVHLNDVNDHPPVFSFPHPGNDTIRLPVDDDVTVTSRQVRAFDLDRGDNAVVRYGVVAGNGSALVTVTDCCSLTIVDGRFRPRCAVTNDVSQAAN